MTVRRGGRRVRLAAGMAVTAVLLGGVPGAAGALADDASTASAVTSAASAPLATVPAVAPVPPTGSEITEVGLTPDPEAAADPAPDLTEALDLPPVESSPELSSESSPEPAPDEVPEEATPAPEAAQPTDPSASPGDAPSASDEPATDEPATDEPATDEPATDEPTAPATAPAAETLLSASGLASGFAVVGVTWDIGTAPDGTTVAVRSRTGADWTDWEPIPVEIDGADAADAGRAGVRDGTEPFAVGTVDEVEVALNGVDGVNPANPELAIIDPDANPGGGTTVTSTAGTGGAEVGDAVWRPTANEATTSEATASEATATVSETTTALAAPLPFSAASSTTPATATSTSLASAGSLASAASVPRPRIYTRAEWGADESLMRWTPQIGRVDGAVIHHTVNGNTYSADQVPSLLRGIYAYHAVSRGWGDIGYNVIVDRFGRAWEGRAGGVDRAVIGAHATGWNSTRFGISVIGDFTSTAPSAAALEAVAQVVTWKLSLHGVTPGPSTIVGHRDVGQTACPGALLYARLGDIRAAAAARMNDGTDRNVQHDLTGDGISDLALRAGTKVNVASGYRTGWLAPVQAGAGWTGSRTIAPGDFTGDGVPDLMLRNGGTMYLYPGTAAGGWSPRRQVAMTNLAAMDLVVGGHDWNGDGKTDLIARKFSDGTLWLYAGNGSGKVTAPRLIGKGWGQMSLIQTIGKLSDGKPALVARDASGVLYTYRGNGSGGFGPRTTVGSGWGAMNRLVGVGDMDDDGRVDLLARQTNGDLWLYPGNGGGTFGARTRIGLGWGDFTAVLSAGRGGSGQDVYAVTGSGVLRRYVYRGSVAFERRTASGVSGSGVVEVITPGDWNGDGRPDLIARRSNGDLYLHPGSGNGTFAATGTRIGNGWSGMAQVVSGGNWLGTGVPTLVALDRSTGRIWLYPGNGRGAFAPRIMLASGAGDVDLIAAPGRWTGGRAPDLITRVAGTGVLQVRRGDGGATLGAPTQIGSGWQGMGVVAVGDVTGDGRPDLAATAGTGLRVYPGNGVGGFLATRAIGKVPAGTAIS